MAGLDGRRPARPTSRRPVRCGCRRPSRRSSVDQPHAHRVDADALDPHRRSRDDQSRDDQEGGRGEIAGDSDLCGLQLGFADQLDVALALLLAEPDVRRRTVEQPFGMVAGRHRLDHPGDPGDVEPGEQQCRLDLRRGDGEPEGRRDGRAERRAGSAAGARRAGGDLGADPPQRLRSTRSIGRRESEASPMKCGLDRMARDQAHQQPRRSAAIAHVERRFAAGAGRRCRRRRRSSCRRRARSATPIARSAAAVDSTSLPSQRPSIRLRPTAIAASISARWEIDLSPGTVATSLDRAAPADRHRLSLGGRFGLLRSRGLAFDSGLALWQGAARDAVGAFGPILKAMLCGIRARPLFQFDWRLFTDGES